MDIEKRLRAMHPKCNVDELYQKYKNDLLELERSAYPDKPDRDEFNRLVELINKRCEALGEPAGRRMAFEEMYGAEKEKDSPVLPKPKRYDEKKMLELGRLWEKNGMKRIYFNALSILFDVEYYKSGNVKKAAWKGTGDEISNGEATSIAFSKLYYDYSTNSLEGDLKGECRDMMEEMLTASEGPKTPSGTF